MTSLCAIQERHLIRLLICAMQTNPPAKWHCWHLKHNIKKKNRENGALRNKRTCQSAMAFCALSLSELCDLDPMQESFSINRDLMGGCGGLVKTVWSLGEAPDCRVLLCWYRSQLFALLPRDTCLQAAKASWRGGKVNPQQPV